MSTTVYSVLYMKRSNANMKYLLIEVTNITSSYKFQPFPLYRRSQTKVFTEVLVTRQAAASWEQHQMHSEWLPDLRGLGAGKLTRPLSSVSVYEFLEKQFKEPSSFDGPWTPEHEDLYQQPQWVSVEYRKITQFVASFSRMQHRL